MTVFGIDAASFQGNLDWAAVDQVTGFGWEKVTEGTGYTNPYWDGPTGHAKAAMIARGKASGFIPGGYMFLREAPGAAQADYFAAHAGNMDGLAIAIDVEPTTGSNPTLAQAQAAVAKLRTHYPRHPITGYIPHWYWGHLDTTFVDVLWASNYVTRPAADPLTMYQAITPAMWAPYGGQAPKLLQFTSHVRIPGVSGAVDCSVFEGAPSRLRTLLLPAPVPLPAPIVPEDRHAGGKTSLRAAAHHESTSVPRALWLMSQDPAKVTNGGWGHLQRKYIAAGDWDAPMKAGTVYWVG